MFAAFLLTFTLALSGTRAARGNTTIDDADPLVVFEPLDRWSRGGLCPGCVVKPDVNLVHNGTWLDTAYFASDTDTRRIIIPFTGLAVYVYCIIANQVTGTPTLTSLTFKLDGRVVGSYIHEPDGFAPQYVYNVPVYTDTSIPNGPHILELSSSAADSVTLFDYLEYTYDTSVPLDVPPPPRDTVRPPLGVIPSPSSPPQRASSNIPNSSESQQPPPVPVSSDTKKPKLPLGAIIGGAVGGAIALALFILVGLLAIRQRRKTNAPKITFQTGRDPRFEVDPSIGPPLSQLATISTDPSAGGGSPSIQPTTTNSNSNADLNSIIGCKVAHRQAELARWATVGEDAHASHPNLDQTQQHLEVIEALRREVDELRAEQRRLVQVADPPPIYHIVAGT